MRSVVDLAILIFLHAEGRDGVVEPGIDATDRRTVPGDAFLRCLSADLASTKRRHSGERKTYPPADAAHEPDANPPEAERQQSGQGAQDLSVSARVDHPNQVWADDITYRGSPAPSGMSMRRGFLYLVAIMDWHTRKVLAWRISNTLEADFCVEALSEAIHKFGPPEIINTDQSSQFTSFAWTDRLKRNGVRISMDGKGRFLDNIFVEWLWRSLKYEKIRVRLSAYLGERITGQSRCR